jgi:hypothetical protein
MSRYARDQRGAVRPGVAKNFIAAKGRKDHKDKVSPRSLCRWVAALLELL